jgi:hypothetical protein
MTPYYRLEPGIHELYGIADYPHLPDGVSFLTGRPIAAALPEPLVFTVNHPQGEAPKHLLGMQVPVVSDLLLRTVAACGVDNFQSFPAQLRSVDGAGQWSGYHAFNAIGLIDAADMRGSKYGEIMPGDDEVPPLVDFQTLVIDGSRTRDLLLFRLLQNPGAMLVHERVRNELRQRKPPGGWGITLFEIAAR